MSIDLSAVDALKMFEQAEMGEDPAPQVEEVKAEPAPTPEAPKAEAEPVQEPEAQREPEGIATKDGKHVIPYSVLQSERTRAAQAERELQEARARLAELTATAESKPTAKPGDPADTTEISKEDEERLAALEEDFPTVAAELKATRAAMKAMQEQIAQQQASHREIAAQREAQTAMTVQEAIDSVPKLAHIQASNPEAFELAQQFDNTLRARNDWTGKPMTERFAKVIELVEASLGEIAIPGHTAPPAGKDPEALKQAAAAKVASAPKAVPTSLSQFPAGEPVAADETAAVEQMTTAQLAGKLARMTPDQIDAYFANL